MFCLVCAWRGGGGEVQEKGVKSLKKETDFKKSQTVEKKESILTEVQRLDREVHDGKSGPGLTGEPAGSHLAPPTALRDGGKD